MSRTKKEANRTDELLDELLLDYRTPADIIGEGGLLKQLSQRLIERSFIWMRSTSTSRYLGESLNELCMWS
jgi:hypothetical protein